MPISTRSQQIAQQSLGLLNQSPHESEMSRQIKEWFYALEIILSANEMIFGKSYTLTPEQVLHVAELDLSPPGWFIEPNQPLQHAVPGFSVAFLQSTGRYTIMSVTETRTINQGSTELVGLPGIAQGWYNLEGLRTTKEGLTFQGSAYAGRIFPVTLKIHSIIEQQALLTEITGHHKAYSGEGLLYEASNEILSEIRNLLQRCASQEKVIPGPTRH